MIYNRKTEELAEEKVYKSRAMRFFYGTALGGLCVLLLRLPFVSKIYGVTQRGKRSLGKAERFIRENGIDMSNYASDYKSFNEFFIRKRLRIDFDAEPSHFIAPADSVLLAYTIDSGMILRVKDRAYTLAGFLQDEALAREYEGGLFLIFRLRVFDYHRFSFTDDGEVISYKRVKGLLDTVNQNASGIFALTANARDVSVLRTENFGNMVYSEVGAMLVGRIVQTYDGTVFKRGGEKGYFEFGGSTVVLVLKKGTVALDSDILKYSAQGIETKVTLGEKIGKKKAGA
jgi:phosphatidylserine decarboxylase